MSRKPLYHAEGAEEIEAEIATIDAQDREDDKAVAEAESARDEFSRLLQIAPAEDMGEEDYLALQAKRRELRDKEADKITFRQARKAARSPRRQTLHIELAKRRDKAAIKRVERQDLAIIEDAKAFDAAVVAARNQLLPIARRILEKRKNLAMSMPGGARHGWLMGVAPEPPDWAAAMPPGTKIPRYAPDRLEDILIEHLQIGLSESPEGSTLADVLTERHAVIMAALTAKPEPKPKAEAPPKPPTPESEWSSPMLDAQRERKKEVAARAAEGRGRIAAVKARIAELGKLKPDDPSSVILGTSNHGELLRRRDELRELQESNFSYDKTAISGAPPTPAPAPTKTVTAAEAQAMLGGKKDLNQYLKR
jgi:hypothetical protein